MFSIHKLAVKAGCFLARELGSDSRIERRLAFGLELLLGSAVELILIMLLACFLGILRETLIIVVVAGIMRLVSGGEHCRAYYRCLIAGTVIFLTLGWLAGWLNTMITYQSVVFLAVVSFPVILLAIWRYAPAETENKPLSTTEKARGRKLSLIIAGILSGVIILFLVGKIRLNCVLPAILGLLCQVFTLTPWGYSFIRKVDGILSFSGHRGDESELEGLDSRR